MKPLNQLFYLVSLPLLTLRLIFVLNTAEVVVVLLIVDFVVIHWHFGGLVGYLQVKLSLILGWIHLATLLCISKMCKWIFLGYLLLSENKKHRLL